MIILSPWSVQAMQDLSLRVFNLIERYRVSPFVMAEEATGHLRETITVQWQVEAWDRKKGKGGSPFGIEEDRVPPMVAFGEGERLAVTGSNPDPYVFGKTDDPEARALSVKRIHQKILKNRGNIVGIESYFIADSEGQSLPMDFRPGLFSTLGDSTVDLKYSNPISLRFEDQIDYFLY